jgi:hypothetical protein
MAFKFAREFRDVPSSVIEAAAAAAAGSSPPHPVCGPGLLRGGDRPGAPEAGSESGHDLGRGWGFVGLAGLIGRPRLESEL